MLIAADRQIPGADDILGALGDVRRFDGRTVTPSEVADADALIVRSVTKVDARLLTGSRVRFVGTTTSGTDHVDTAYLASRGITFADAAGSNARPVAEYVLTAILLLADRHGFDPRDKTLGVVGVGRIGSRVAHWAESLGMTVLRCDPPLAKARGTPASPEEPQAFPARRDATAPTHGRPIPASTAHPPSVWTSPAQLQAASDIITLHVPLTLDGPHKTVEMVNAAWLGELRPGALLINTSRGAVVSERDLHNALAANRPAGAILDVWQDEPNIDAALVTRCQIATPHIAGLSIEAKRRAVSMIHRALEAWARQQGLIEGGSTDAGQTPPATTQVQNKNAAARVNEKNPDHVASREALEAMRRACDLRGPDARLRDVAKRGTVAADFDTIRSQCGTRREFASTPSDLTRLGPATESFLRELGFAQ